LDVAPRAQAEPIYSCESLCTPEEGDGPVRFDFKVDLNPRIVQVEPLPDVPHVSELELVSFGDLGIPLTSGGQVGSGKATALLLVGATGKPPLVNHLWARECTKAPEPPADSIFHPPRSLCV
jgi:hypothetical protein